jgi:hypothetical protein
LLGLVGFLQLLAVIYELVMIHAAFIDRAVLPKLFFDFLIAIVLLLF